LLAASGATAFATWARGGGPSFFVYGVLYSAADHRHHELSHGTPFKTRWINDAFSMCAHS